MTETVHPEFAAHGSFEHLKLGRKAKSEDARTLRLADYLDDAVLLPAIPETFDLAPKGVSYPMYGNDHLGDCTCACVGHLIQVWTALAGAPATPADAVVEKLYIPETGSDDTGRMEIDVLNYWKTTGTDDGHKIAAYVSVDPSNHDHVRAALYLFGGVYDGVALPKTAQGQPVWDVVGDPADENGPAYPGSWGGHAIPKLPVWDGKTFQVVTWGAVLEETIAFNDAYTDESYAIVSPDFFGADAKTIDGFAIGDLESDLADLAASK
jgi:hypothetical protein